MRNLEEVVEIHKNLHVKVWSKDKPKRRLSALLKFQSHKILLEIEGEILEEKSVFVKELFASDSNAQYFIFVNCHMMMVTYGRRKRTMLEAEQCLFYPDKPTKLEPHKADYIESTYKYLDYWINQTLFELQPKEHKVKYSPRWKKRIIISPDLELCFYANIHNLYNFNINKRNQLNIEQKGFFSLKYSATKKLEDIVAAHTKIENLLKLAYFNLLSEEYMTLANTEEEIRMHKTRHLPATKELYFPRSQVSSVKPPPIIDWMFLFKFTDIPNKTKFFREWLENEEELSPIYLPVINLLSATLPEEYKFLGLINALELAYRRRYPPTDKQKKNYLSSRNVLLSQIETTKKADKLLFEKLKSMTSYGYQPSLKALLTDLVKRSRKIVYVEIDDDDIKKIVAIRRNFIHNNFGNGNTTEVFWLNRKLLKLLLVVLLLDLGFSARKTNYLITNYSQNNNLNIR